MDLKPFTVEGWALATLPGEEEPRMRDIDLAERLKYAQPRMIRKLIARLIECGDLVDVCERYTVARSQTPTGGEREYKVREYRLTEAQSLFVTTRSETKESTAMTMEVIRVFTLARKGLLPSQQLDGNAIVHMAVGAVKAVLPEMLREVLGEIRAEFAATRTEVQEASKEVIGRAVAKAEILDPLSEIAWTYCRGKDEARKAWRSKRKTLELRVRDRVGMTQRGKLENLPKAKLSDARIAIREMAEDAKSWAIAEWGRRQDTKQADLPFAGNK